MLYRKLFKSLEAAGWSMADDATCSSLDGSTLCDRPAIRIKENAITERRALRG